MNHPFLPSLFSFNCLSINLIYTQTITLLSLINNSNYSILNQFFCVESIPVLIFLALNYSSNTDSLKSKIRIVQSGIECSTDIIGKYFTINSNPNNSLFNPKKNNCKNY